MFTDDRLKGLIVCVCLFGQMDSLQTDINTWSTEVQTFSTQLSELKRTFQSLEISRQSIITEVG